MIVNFGNTQDMFLKNTLILRPHKLIELIKRFISSNDLENENDDGLMDERTFETLCQPYIEQKQTLLALLKKFDLLCERISPATNTTICKQYYVPSCIPRISSEKISLEKDEQSVVFYYLFDGYFPESLFHQILVRTIKWSQTNHVSTPKLSYRRGKFLLDDQHVLILTASSMKYARMKIQILRNNSTSTNTITTANNNNNKSQEELNSQLADPAIVAKVSYIQRNIVRKRAIDLGT